MQTLAKVVLVASLISWLAGCGLQTSTGTPVASGKVWFFDPGTNVPQTVWADSAESATLSQPVILDAAGRATVYTKNTVDIVVEDSSGASLGTLGNANDIPAAEVTVDPSVSAGPHLSDALTAALGSFGAPDFQYQDSSGATPMNVGAWISSVQINVKAFGAKGDGLAIDTTAIQKAINRVKALGGGVVYFPPGTYLIDAALVLSSATGVTFSGAGRFASVIKSTNGGADALTLTGCSDIQVTGLGITHSSTSTGNGITASGTLLSVSKLNIQGYMLGVSFTGIPSSVAASVVSESTIFMINNAASRCLSYNYTGALFENVIDKCTLIDLAGAAAPLVELNGNTRNMAISSTYFDNNASVAIRLNNGLTAAGGFGISVSNCPSLNGFATPFEVLTADSRGLTQSNNNVNGYTQDVASGGTVVPNWARGQVIRYRGTSIGAAYVIGVPIPTPATRGVMMTLELFNNAGAPVTGWTFNGIFHRSATAVSLLDGHTGTITFVYDLDAAAWREVSISDST